MCRTADPATAETFHAIPLKGRADELLGVLLVGSSRRELVQVQSFIRSIALVAGGVGVLLAVLLSWWAAARITRPVEELAGAARNVAAGNWSVRVDSTSSDEVGELARAFNQMTRQLTDQREKLLAAERVAAWRELARRLAHELKNPLHPLQITVENMQRARAASPEQFDEVFRESTGTLLGEIENLRTIVARFSDFAKMPPPEPRRVEINDVVRNVTAVSTRSSRAILSGLKTTIGTPVTFVFIAPATASVALVSTPANWFIASTWSFHAYSYAFGRLVPGMMSWNCAPITSVHASVRRFRG